MTPLERVLATLGHREPDRVPLFLLFTMHGARELGLSIKEYFAKAENVVEGQLRLRAKYGHDCLYNLFYGAIEIEAWGGEVLFRDDGPPNVGAPIIRRPEDILQLEPPAVAEAPSLAKVLEATRRLRQKAGPAVPIVGVVVSPFSLPVEQLGFAGYIELIYERRDLFARLMAINEEFCVAWANAQLAAGATAIAYLDPLSSPNLVPPELARATGLAIARRTIARIKGLTAFHMGSCLALPIVDDIAASGAGLLGASALEDLAALKTACRGRLALLGNLNGIAMRRWTPQQAEAAVKDAIARAGRGGGFILADNHGEIPWQVPDDVLQAIAEATREWGRYPLSWVDSYGG